MTDPELKGGILITGLKHRCPNCGAEGQFNTGDYFVPKEEPAAATKASPATLDGDQESEQKTEQESEAGRLAGFGVEGALESKKTAGPPPSGDTPAGG